jgi:HEAT repeat protein
MLVFAFDRDWTVDVNPHPRHEAVPLEWVRHLAHETEHAVYAIGNQALADEAAIPGVVDIVGMHPDDWNEWLGEKRPDGYYERFPTRRERLGLIAELHPDADGYVVVDDLDLSDVDGWDHYHAWEFVPAVERGTIDPGLRWVHEPRTDGGRPSAVGITPVDAGHLDGFLDEHADALGFEITYEDDTVAEGTQRRVVGRVELLTKTVHRAVPPVVKCYPIPPEEPSFSVCVHDIRLLSVVRPPAELYFGDAKMPAERAAALRRLANDDPLQVDVSKVLTFLDCIDPTPKHDALRALWAVAAARPADCTPALPILRSLLGHDDFPHADLVLEILATLAEADAADVAPLADTIAPRLGATDTATQRAAARCVSELAAHDSADVVDTVPTLATILEDGAEGRQYAAYALCRIAADYPEEVKPVVPALQELVVDETASDNERLSATAALGRVTGEYPDAALPIVDDLATLLEADNRKLRNNAIGLLGDIAKLHQDWVVPYAEELAAFVDVDDTYTRINTTGALSRLAQTHPAAIEPFTQLFVGRLDDDHEFVRENACWALGHLEAESARTPLESVAVDDQNDDVRTRAQWALDRLR